MAESISKLSKLVGKIIQIRRKKLGFSQNVFAEKIGIGQQSLSAMERGEIAPKFERLSIIADSLHCPVSDLFRYPDEDLVHYTETFSDIMKNLTADERRLIMEMLYGVADIFRKNRKSV